jgi:hypothetical protein
MADDVSDEVAALDFASVSPEKFARLVKGLSNQEIAKIMRGELRQRVIGEVFGRMGRQFRPDNAGSLNAMIRWKVTGETETTHEISIADGACTVHEGLTDGKPRTTLAMGDTEFLKLVSGNGNPVKMFMTRKLKLSGDITLAAALPRLFDIPKIPKT